MSLIESNDIPTTNAVRAELLSALSLHLDVDERRLDAIASSLFKALVVGVEQALEAAIEKNILPAHEAKSTARHRMLLDEIANLRQNIALMSSQSKPDVRSVLDFEIKYLEQVGCVHSHIKPPARKWASCAHR